MNGKELAVAIKGGKRVYGTMVFSPSPLLASYISNLGVDFVFIDTEHVPMDRHQLSWMCQAYKALGKRSSSDRFMLHGCSSNPVYRSSAL